MNGQEIIDSIAKKLNEEGIPPYDSAILNRLSHMSMQDLLKMIKLNNVE